MSRSLLAIRHPVSMGNITAVDGVPISVSLSRMNIQRNCEKHSLLTSRI